MAKRGRGRPPKDNPRKNAALQRARLDAGLSVEECAYLVGVHHAMWEMWEANTRVPTLEQAFLCSWVLGQSIEDLFWGAVGQRAVVERDPDQEFIIGLLGDRRR